jgi:hypothetical protein
MISIRTFKNCEVFRWRFPVEMTTRSRTLLYLNFRNNLNQNNVKKNNYGNVELSESSGLIKNAVDGDHILEMSPIHPKW